MKAFKKLASLCLGLILCAGLCAFAACGEKEAATETSSPVATESSSTAPETEEATAYVFTVLDKDGNPAKDMAIILCKDNGCLAPQFTNENGVATCAVDKGEYEIHVAHKSDVSVSGYLAFEGAEKTANTYGEYTLKLKA